jgi:hypothetical protein
MTHEQIKALEPFLESILKPIVDSLVDARLKENGKSITDPLVQNEEAQKTRERITLINAKEYITLNEAAFLLSCSPAYLRKLVGLARKGQAKKSGRAKNLIPYRDLDGLVSFHREELLEWARPSHLKLVTESESSA